MKVTLSPKDLIKKSLVSAIKSGGTKLPSIRALEARHGIGRTKALNILRSVAKDYPEVIVAKSSGYAIQESVQAHPAISALLDNFSLDEIQAMIAAELARRERKTITIIGSTQSKALIEAELRDLLPLGIGGIQIGSDYANPDIEMRLKLTNHSPLISSIFRQKTDATIGIISDCDEFSEQVLGAIGVCASHLESIMVSSIGRRHDCNIMLSTCNWIITDCLSFPLLKKAALYHASCTGKIAPNIRYSPHVSKESIQELQRKVANA